MTAGGSDPKRPSCSGSTTSKCRVFLHFNQEQKIEPRGRKTKKINNNTLKLIISEERTRTEPKQNQNRTSF